jgi:hypothetical protein
MKHEHRYAEHPSCAREDRTLSTPDSVAETSSAEVKDMHQERQYDTAWNNWKSVRDVA